MKSIFRSFIIGIVFLFLGCRESIYEKVPKSGFSYVLNFDRNLDDLTKDRLSTHLLDFGGADSVFSRTESASGRTVARLALPNKKVNPKNQQLFYQRELSKLRNRLEREGFLPQFELKIVDAKGNLYKEEDE
jgi:hypothetical protein